MRLDEDECLSHLYECVSHDIEQRNGMPLMTSHSQIPSLKEIDEGGEGCSVILS